MIVLPWPDKGLSPNSRLHWAAKGTLRKKARQWANNAALAAIPFGMREVRAKFSGDGPIPVTVTFYPPDRRQRDDDNMVGSFKSYRDGIADALGVNDRRFRPIYVFADPEKPGRVTVEFIPGSDALEEKPGNRYLADSVLSAMKNDGPESALTLNPGLPINAYEEREG